MRRRRKTIKKRSFLWKLHVRVEGVFLHRFSLFILLVLGGAGALLSLFVAKSLFFHEESVFTSDFYRQMSEVRISRLVDGHPIEVMVPAISRQPSQISAYLVAIAKKESNWGKRHPVLNGRDCYNYWGYRGKRRLMGSGGHTCFNSRKDAVDTVAKRIEWLVLNQDRTTPEDMIIWKCGYSCDGHDPESVRKWISDVSLYFDKLNQ
ncbi:MAG: hypothetical protein KC736_00460 [Candidatus Moranbacteria bacterium]|nr:hypothetical protein [Candidatus Moranbacteria bacterium]